jgi:uncharacterized membrane protein YhfC
MITATIPLAVALMIVLPIVFVRLLARTLDVPLVMAVAGAATFLASQALRLPLLQGLTSLFESGALPAPPQPALIAFNIAVLSLTAGLFEESARYGAYRYAIPHARSWNAAAVFGAGHGAAEAVVLGALMGIEYAGMLAAGAPAAGAVPPGTDPAAHARLAETAARYWSLPAYMPLLGALERAFSLCFHVAMAIVVLQAVLRRNWLWLAAAIAAHAAANAIATAVLVGVGPVAAEIVVGLIAALSLYVAFALRDRPPPDERPGAA